MEDLEYPEVKPQVVCRDCSQFVVYTGQTKCPHCGPSPFHITSYQATRSLDETTTTGAVRSAWSDSHC